MLYTLHGAIVSDDESHIYRIRNLRISMRCALAVFIRKQCPQRTFSRRIAVRGDGDHRVRALFGSADEEKRHDLACTKASSLSNQPITLIISINDDTNIVGVKYSSSSKDSGLNKIMSLYLAQQQIH